MAKQRLDDSKTQREPQAKGGEWNALSQKKRDAITGRFIALTKRVVKKKRAHPLKIERAKQKVLPLIIHRAAVSSAESTSDTLGTSTVLDAEVALDLLDNSREPKKALLDLLDLN